MAHTNQIVIAFLNEKKEEFNGTPFVITLKWAVRSVITFIWKMLDHIIFIILTSITLRKIKEREKKTKHHHWYEKKMPGEWKVANTPGRCKSLYREMHGTNRPIFRLAVVIVQKLRTYTLLCATIFNLTHLINFSIWQTWTNTNTNTNSTSNVHFWLDLEHFISILPPHTI